MHKLGRSESTICTNLLTNVHLFWFSCMHWVCFYSRQPWSWRCKHFTNHKWRDQQKIQVQQWSVSISFFNFWHIMHNTTCTDFILILKFCNLFNHMAADVDKSVANACLYRSMLLIIKFGSWIMFKITRDNWTMFSLKTN